MAVNIHITIIELNALHTKRQNLFQELDAVIHLLDRKSGSAGMPRPISYAVFCLKKKSVLYTMQLLGLAWNRGYKKSARVVGACMGKFHPHGDSAIYETLVRMVQDFSLRYPLVDGQGNFGSIDGDPAAAMRYTEARMARIAHELLADIDKDTVDFVPNYDDNEQEPVVLPTRIPNLLVNGSAGIAVGMATNIPPHNMTEVVNALVMLVDDPS